MSAESSVTSSTLGCLPRGHLLLEASYDFHPSSVPARVCLPQTLLPPRKHKKVQTLSVSPVPRPRSASRGAKWTQTHRMFWHRSRVLSLSGPTLPSLTDKECSVYLRFPECDPTSSHHPRRSSKNTLQTAGHKSPLQSRAQGTT